MMPRGSNLNRRVIIADFSVGTSGLGSTWKGRGTHAFDGLSPTSCPFQLVVTKQFFQIYTQAEEVSQRRFRIFPSLISNTVKIDCVVQTQLASTLKRGTTLCHRSALRF
jgi:hypothetical protein